jgi:hypothetical protein
MRLIDHPNWDERRVRRLDELSKPQTEIPAEVGITQGIGETGEMLRDGIRKAAYTSAALAALGMVVGAAYYVASNIGRYQGKIEIEIAEEIENQHEETGRITAR